MQVVSEKRRDKSTNSIGFLLLFLAATLVSLAQAQQTDTGTIAGKILSAAGAPISGAKVTITNRSTGQTSVVDTDATGSFTSPGLPPDDYTLRADARSFISTTAVLTVQAGVATPIDLRLDPEPLPGIVTAHNAENRLANGESFPEYVQLEPGTQALDGATFDPTKSGFSLLSFDGRFGRARPVEVDGLNVTDETVGTATVNVPVGAIGEVDFGGVRAPLVNQLISDGAVNVVTRSGTNDLHGEAFGLYRNGAVLSAGLPGGSSHSWQRQHYGGRLGGALIADKLWIFLEGERSRVDLTNPVLFGGPFKFLPPSMTAIREPFRETDTVDRLDYKWSTKARLFYRFSYDQNSDLRPFASGPSLEPLLTRTSVPVHALGVDRTSEASTHLFRFEYLKFTNSIVDRSSEINPAVNPVPYASVNIGGGARQSCAPGSFFCSGLTSLAPQRTLQSDLEFRYDGTHASKNHSFRFGFTYNRILTGGFAGFFALGPTLSNQGGTQLPANALLGSTGDPADPLNYPVEWAFLGNGQGFSSERAQFGLPAGGRRDNAISAYLGDLWKARPDLAVSYGTAWIRNDGRSDSDLASIPQLNAWGPRLGNRVRQPDLNFAPQLGIAWNPGTGKSTLRGGIGLFYNNAILNNLFFDRPLRLAQGSFLATPAACVGGAPGSIQWPSSPGVSGTLVANGAGVVNSNGTVSPTWCDQSIRVAAPRAAALEQAYQAATAAVGSAANPSFIGAAGAFAGPNQNGLSLLAPNYHTPRSVEVNLGLEHQFRPGLILTLDYFRNVTTRDLLGVDVNHGGAAATFNLNNALADRDAAQVRSGCPAGSNQVGCMVARLGPAGALRAYGSAGIGGPAQVTGGAPCHFCAFPGVHPDLGVNVMEFPVGRSVFGSFDLSLKEHLAKFFVHGVERASFDLSYSHSRYVSQAADEGFLSQATDFDNPDRFTGPAAVDRTHQIAMGGYFELQRSLRLGITGHFASPLPVTLAFPQNSGGAEVLVTDWTGDGTTGDIIPGTNVGSYMRSIKPKSLAALIQRYNTNNAGSSNPATPAGNMLVNGGVFSLAQLEQIGGILQPLAAPVLDVAGLGWLKTFDLKLGWQHKFGDRVTFEPSLSLFNLFNLANFDLPGNTQGGILSFGAGSLSPSAAAQQPQGTVGGTSADLKSVSGRTNRGSLQSGLNGQGAPRSVEWGLKISF
jgi:hypothetical protein